MILDPPPPYDCSACMRCGACGRHWHGEPDWTITQDGRTLVVRCPDHPLSPPAGTLSP